MGTYLKIKRGWRGGSDDKVGKRLMRTGIQIPNSHIKSRPGVYTPITSKLRWGGETVDPVSANGKQEVARQEV